MFYATSQCVFGDKELLREYNSQSETGKWLKHFFGLSLLPPDEVLDGFIDLASLAPPNNSAAQDFMNYVQDNYVVMATFPPELWASPPSFDPKSTNGAESFHAGYNAEFYNPHPCLEDVIQVLVEIQAETRSKLASINRNMVNPMKPATTKRIDHAISQWNLYQAGKQAAKDELEIQKLRLHYIKEMGYLYQGKKLK